jgi:transposase
MTMGTRGKQGASGGTLADALRTGNRSGAPFLQAPERTVGAGKFDQFAEQECARFYAENNGRPSRPPGTYFRLLLIGYFEGIDSERGIAWRAADSLGLRQFLHIGLDENTPDHSTISRNRRLIDVETHRKIFLWVLCLLADRGLLKGRTVGVDATTLEANAAMRSILRCDSGANYEEFLKGLAQQSGIATPTREDMARLDRSREKKTSNQEWVSPSDADARITKMKDGTTHLAHKAEHAVDMETGAVVAVTLQAADQGDTTTMKQTLAEAGETIAQLVRREAEQAPHEKPQVNVNGIAEVGGRQGLSQRTCGSGT